MPGTVKSGLLSDADKSYKCDSQEKVCWILNLPLDKGHFITEYIVWNPMVSDDEQRFIDVFNAFMQPKPADESNDSSDTCNCRNFSDHCCNS